MDIKLYMQASQNPRRQLPHKVNEKIDRHERDGTYDDPEYKGATFEY